MNDLAKQGTGAMSTSSSAIPDYIRTDTSDKGLDSIRQIMRPPFLKVRQAQCRNDEMKAATKLGDIIIMPDCEVLYQFGQAEPFRFVVLFSFVEYCLWNPYELVTAKKLGFIRDRTLDPRSDLAQRCKVRKREERFAVCPEVQQQQPDKVNDEKYMMKYMEHLNFVILPRTADGELLRVPTMWSCVSGEAKTGRRLANLIGGVDAHIFARNYCAHTSERNGEKGDWFGLNPIVDRERAEWVTAQEFVDLKASAEGFRKAFEEGNVEYNYDNEDAARNGEVDPDSSDSEYYAAEGNEAADSL